MGKRYESRVGVQVVASRPDYLSVLLTSLRVQNYREWDLVLVYQDEKIPTNKCVATLLARLVNEGHRINLVKAESGLGLGVLRNMALEKDNCEFGLRIDDDSMCETDYIEILVDHMKDNVGIVGGIVPFMGTKNFAPVKPYFNKIDESGNITDDCIFFYNTLEESFPSDHIRSSYMYRNDDAMDLKFPTYNDSMGAFREETDFCIRMKLFKKKEIVFVPNAVCWHLMAEYAGTRGVWTKDIIKLADDNFRAKVKEYKVSLNDKK